MPNNKKINKVREQYGLYLFSEFESLPTNLNGRFFGDARITLLL